jgi:hypothetical protein
MDQDPRSRLLEELGCRIVEMCGGGPHDGQLLRVEQPYPAQLILASNCGLTLRKVMYSNASPDVNDPWYLFVGYMEEDE